MEPAGITIDGRLYTRDEIISSTGTIRSLNPEIHACLRDWFDDRDFIEAKTSGSTGIPKTIRLKKEKAIASARATLEYFSLKPGDTALLAMPVRYIAGRMMLIRALTGQLHLVTTPPAAIPQLPDRPLTFAAFTPHQYASLLKMQQKTPLPTIEKIILGGSPVPENLRIPPGEPTGTVYETFGMTETYSHIAVRKIHPEYDSFFEAVPGAEFRSENQQLVIRAPHLGIEHLKTHDIVRLLSPTRFEWLGRSDFVINSGGIKLFPEEIEKKLTSEIPEPFYITGRPHPELGSAVALVTEDSEIKPSGYWSRIFNRFLEKYEKPKSILYVRRIERTATGKINRSLSIKKENILHETKPE